MYDVCCAILVREDRSTHLSACLIMLSGIVTGTIFNDFGMVRVSNLRPPAGEEDALEYTT